MLNASTMIAELGRSGGVADANPVPAHDLMLAGIAIGIWAIAIACIVSWTRARERARARAHIRWMRFSRRDPHPNLLPGPGEGTEASKTGSSGGQAALFMDELPRVQGHGGRIFVDTTGGDGTCYTLELRVRQEG